MLVKAKSEYERLQEEKILFRIGAAAQAFRNEIIGLNFSKEQSRQAIMSVDFLLDDLKKRTRK